MSTGVISIMLHQLPYHAHWLNIISYIFFVLNLVLFLIFTFISILRYTLYPQIFPAVMRHPHQSLFVATFPVGLATLINMIVLVCAPAWGHGWATFAWVLWWIDSVLALATCFQLTFVMWVRALPDFLPAHRIARLMSRQIIQPPQRTRRNDRPLPYPHRCRRDCCHIRWTCRGLNSQPAAPALDPHHQLRLLGHRVAAKLDYLDALFPTVDGASAAEEGGDCEFTVADWAAWIGGIFVSIVCSSGWEADEADEVIQDHLTWQISQAPLRCYKRSASCSECGRRVLCCWVHARDHSVGFCDRLVCSRFDDDGCFGKISFQYGVVGFYFPSR